MDRKKRTTLLTLGAVIGGYAGLQALTGLLPGRLNFVPLSDPPGFRAFRAGRVSSNVDPFIGIGAQESQEAAARKADRRAEVSANICEALFGPDFKKPGQVSIASFSDYYCPFCRVQTQQLADLEEQRKDVSIAWHELPLLGETSIQAAKAALAAKRQGAYVAFHKRLMRSRFVAAPEYLTVMAEDLGIDAQTLLADIESNAVATELETSAALGQIFALIGTPALVIGRVVVLGEVNQATVARLIDLERDQDWQEVCV